MPLSSIPEILEDLRQGKMVVIMDDEDRENEGDLLMAASLVRPEDINFMATNGRGLICLTLTRERCKQLALPLMVSDNREAQGTAFTVSIEAAEGVTTGISAYDRAHTIRTAVSPNAVPRDIVQPGHIFPLMAQPGGVLTRAGHTEAGCDLARLAGLEPAAVIVEILKEDGTMARRPDLEVFAAQHGLKMGTIADLIAYRIKNEKTVERVASCDWKTDAGEFRLHAYRDAIDKGLHYALVKGQPRADVPTMVRVQVQHTLCDLFGAGSGECGWPLRDAMKRVADEGCGVVVMLHRNERPEEIVDMMRRLERGPGEGGKTDGGMQHLRTYGIGAQILMDLGVHKMRVLAAPMVMHGLSGFDLEVVEYVES
ncbi:MAG: 3,4-dihydroxy-2-butanone-4-phosphate synthase [Gammaproteobacteria bacterium]|nr:3,4-dihydroxy-2-butanone-4-phosphate synthase [Gammaproteobacteria bacterium]